jgi:hypothetical protein
MDNEGMEWVEKQTYDADLEIVTWSPEKDFLLLGCCFLWGHFLLGCAGPRYGEQTSWSKA